MTNSNDKDCFEILRYLTTNHHLQAGNPFMGNYLRFFNIKGWTNERIESACKYGFDMKWFSYDHTNGIAPFILTKTGYDFFKEYENSTPYPSDFIYFSEDTLKNQQFRCVFCDEYVIVYNCPNLSPGMFFYRKIRDGVTETFIIDDFIFVRQDHGCPDHYKIQYHREGVNRMANTNTYNINGNNARVNNNSIDMSNNFVEFNDKDSAELADELEKVAKLIAKNADGDISKISIAGNLASASTSVKSGEKMLVESSIESLRPNVNFVLDIAKSTGANILARIIAHHFGIQS